MDFVQYKCPCCGAALRFSPGAQKLSCGSCGNEYDLETLRQYEQEEERGSGREEEQELNWNTRGKPREPSGRRTGSISALPAGRRLGRMRTRSARPVPIVIMWS